MTGRSVECCVQPFFFQEFLQIRNVTQYQEHDFYDYIKFGGLPGIHHLEFSEDSIFQYLFAAGDSMLYKDLVIRNQIRDVALLEKLIWFVGNNIGNTFSARRISEYLKKERKGKKILETYEKYYLTDIGLMNAKTGFDEQKILGYLENIVYLELKKRGFQIFLGKLDDLEIDFIAERQGLLSTFK